MNGAQFTCRCRRSVGADSITKYAYYLRLFGPHFVYFKAECPDCGKVLEQFIQQEQWEREFGTAVSENLCLNLEEANNFPQGTL